MVRGFTLVHLALALGGTLGLVTTSAMLVHLSAGLIEAHFHFFIAPPRRA